MTTAALVVFVVINIIPAFNRDLRARLIHRTAYFLLPMVLMPLLGAWYLSTIPAASRTWILGGSPAMTLFFIITACSSMVIAGYALIGLLKHKLYINGATATVLLILAFAATAGGEFVREGARKPYTIRHVLYSNAIAPDEVRELRAAGSVSADPYPLREQARYPTRQLRMGAKVYRLQCSVCHTMAGANGLLHVAGSWSAEQLRINIAKLQYTKAFMPPFAGSADEVEALTQLVLWERAGAPRQWPEQRDPRTLLQIQEWLDTAGVEPNMDIEKGD
jgi:mono/diheme cytochrome c family protein